MPISTPEFASTIEETLELVQRERQSTHAPSSNGPFDPWSS